MLFPYNFQWDYADYHTYSPPWYSGMSQGMAASVFVRAWEVSGDQKYLDMAYASLHPLTYTSPYNLALFEGKDFWIEEYPGFSQNGEIYWDHTLNGGLFGAYGFYDYYLATNNKESYLLFHQAMKTFIRHSGEYDTGYGPAYSLIDMTQLNKIFYLETATSTNQKLPVSKFELYDKSGNFLDDFSFNDGCKYYPIESFDRPQTLSLKREMNRESLLVSSIDLFDDRGSSVTSVNFTQSENVKNEFKILIPNLKHNSNHLKVVVTYKDVGQNIVSLRMKSSCDYSLGTIELTGDGEWHTQEFQLPQNLDRKSSAYLGWQPRREIDTKYVKDATFEKNLGQWNGSWLRFSPNSNKRYI